MQTRCPVEQDELEHDTQTGKYAPFEERFESIFLDKVEDLPPEPPRRKGKWVKNKSGFEVFREDK